MAMQSEDEIVAVISEKASLSKEEILERIEAKEAEFAGLVSRLGAAYIVGKELGIDMVKPVSKELKIKNITPGMRNVTFVGKIVEVQKLREFETAQGKGAVLNVIFGDETGLVRLSLWDDRAKEAVDTLEVGQVWQIVGGYTIKDPFGNAEVRLGKWGNFKKAAVDIKVTAKSLQLKKTKGDYKKIRLNELEEEDFVEVKGHVLQINEKPMVYYFCPVCRARVENEKGCPSHSSSEPEKVLILSGVLDDGYGSVGAVFFRQVAEALIGQAAADVEQKIKEVGQRAFFDSLDVAGEYFKFWGVARRNKISGALEIAVHRLKKINAKEEIGAFEELKKEQMGENG